MELNKPAIASEQTHWYSKTGEAKYTIIGANGKERNTTLRDARKFGYLPSVSAILRVAANPGLDKWKRDTLLMAAATLPKVEGESVEQWMERVEKDSNEQSSKARDLGTEIHGSLERFYMGGYASDHHRVYIDAVNAEISNHFHVKFDDWSAEKSFASPLGYGGKVDLHSYNLVIDFKTSEFDDAAKKEGYPEYIMQLVAYARGLGFKEGQYRCANVLVSTSTPGLVKIIEYTQEEMQTAWEKFLCLLRYWQLDKAYHPMDVVHKDS